MKPKDLLIPFSWENRRPIIIQNLLYVPKHYEKHRDFQDNISFENDNEIHLEYCSGNGQWIIQMARENPNINYFAVEMKFDRARQIWVKMHNENLKNLMVVLSDAQTFTKYYLKDQSISNIFINFPDPWPKKKHAKNRLIQEEFVEDIARVMKKNKIITLVSDHIDYRNQMIDIFLKNESFQSVYQKPYFIQDLQNFGSSFFDSLFRSKGKNINYMKFEKNDRGRGI